MKKQPNRELTTAEVEAALHAALRDEGHLFPQTDEDMANLEISLDLSGVPTPDTNKFRKLLHEHEAENIIQFQANHVSSPVMEENFAMAARNGNKIRDKIRRKMDTARAEHEKQHPHSSNGSH
ncbi:MAG TPA: hypothetical protein VIK59_05065 [Verrucomicrobiae bacterium]